MGNACVAGASPALLEKTGDPAFQWKIYGFSSLLEKGAVATCSDVFHCCGYEWFLAIEPMHKKFGFGSPYIAIHLHLSKSSFEPDYSYIVNAQFELSMYNHSDGTYYGCKATYNFHGKKCSSKTKCLIHLEELLKSSDFLVDDSCAFGVRILNVDISSPRKKLAVVPKMPFVSPEKPVTVHNLFLQKKDFIRKGTYTWTICDFSPEFPEVSPEFEIGGYKWSLDMDPVNGKYSTKSLSLLLHPDPGMLTREAGVTIELTVSILNQKNRKHLTRAGRFTFTRTYSWGWAQFVPRWIIKDPSFGYVVGSTCIVKADIAIIGSSTIVG